MTAPGGDPAALEHLAAALGPGFITALVTGSGRTARLSVISRDTRASEDVHADESGWFWWPWAERTAATRHGRAHRYQPALVRDTYLAALITAVLDQASDSAAVPGTALHTPPGR